MQNKIGYPGNELLATAKSKTFEEAVVQAAKALESQIEKRKTKIAGRKSKQGITGF